MPVHYVYKAEDPVASRAAHLEMVGPDEESLQRERYALLQEVLGEYFRDEVNSEAVEAIINIDPSNLSVTQMVRNLMNPEIDVIDGETGLSRSSDYYLDGGTTFSLDIYEFDKIDEVIDGSEVDEDKRFQHLVIKNAFTHYAYQMQPLQNGEVLTHHSLGYTTEDGTYQPVVTFLDYRHPIRRAIKARDSAAIS